MKFSKLLVQPPHHLVTCTHHKSSLSFFSTSFGTFMQSIMCICLRFATFSVANISKIMLHGCVVEGYRGKTEEEPGQKRPRTEVHIRLNKGHCCGPCSQSWLTMTGAAKYWVILNNSNILKQSLSINIPLTVMCKCVLLNENMAYIRSAAFCISVQ